MYRPTEIRAVLETIEDAGEGQKDDLRIRKVMEAERPACFP